MYSSQLHYIPLALPFFLILAGLLLFLVVLIQAQALRYAYATLGLSSTAALLLLLASPIGSYFNIPIAHLQEVRRSCDECSLILFQRHASP